MNTKFASMALSALLVFSLVLAATAPAQVTQPKVLHNPEVNVAAHFAVSAPMRELAAQALPQQGFHLAPPVQHPKLQQMQKMEEMRLQGLAARVADGALQASSGPLVSATLGLNLLGVGNGFPGYSVPDAPTDVNLAVGDTQVVQWVNVSYAVFNKTTGAVIAGPIEGNTLWSALGGPCASNNSGDIIAQWDKIAHRWVLTQPVFTSPYQTCVAVSKTADATGSYYLFDFPQSPNFPDYPKWGIMPDAYYQSQNLFSGNTFVGAYACAYERAKLLTGDSSAKQICFQTGTFDDGLLPGDLDSASTLPPSGQPEVYLGSIDNGTPNVYEYLFHVDFTTPSNSTFTGDGGTMPISGVASFSLACGGFGACIPQKGITDQLDSLGDRLMYRLAYRNFSGDHQTWLVSHSVTAGSSVGERWYEFRAPENSTSLSVFQQGTFAPDSNYRWMGSIAMDSAGDIALGYSVSGSSVYPSISYTGRVPSDPAGTMETEATIVAGTGSQTATSNRWGDYTSMAIDAADDCTFWYTNQYYMLTTMFDWSTRLASFKFPGCGSTTPDFSLSASPSSQTVVQGNNTSYTATVTSLNGFNSAVALSVISGCPSNTTCSFNPTSVTPPANSSANSTLTVSTTGNTPTGTYTLTIQGTGSSLTHTTTVTLVVNSAPKPDFSISASPSSQTVVQGNNTSYTATATSVNGFSAAVALTVSGCPSNTTCTLNPTSVTPPANGSANSTLTVQTTSSTATGTYTLTIMGVSGSLTHTTTVTLVVNSAAKPDFSITASPSSRSVRRGSNTTYTASVTALNGFTGVVTFSISGCPSSTTCAFNPTTVTGHGNSTLTVSTTSNTPRRTFTLTITGTSGSLNHSTTVSLTVTRH